MFSRLPILLKASTSKLAALRRVAATALAGALFLAGAFLPASAANPTAVAVAGGGPRGVDVMTVNLDVGADILSLVGVDITDPPKLIEAVTKLHMQLLASNPPARLARVADEIAARHPDAVGLEEASLIRFQSPGDLALGKDGAPATDVEFDYLLILVQALESRGVHYAVASGSAELDIELPYYNFATNTVDDIRLTDREAILVRTDLPPGQLRIGNPQSGTYSTLWTVPGVELVQPRGWCSLDLNIRGQDLRLIATHLEIEYRPDIQQAQAQELVVGPADVDVPVVICGDFNSDPFNRDGSFGLAYDAVIHAGFADAWDVSNPNEPEGGLTWGHDQPLADPTASFDRRIDFVFYRGGKLRAIGAEVLEMPLNTTVPPLWPTDHAGVGASILFQ